ncbi:2Fe-2S iron-sulfur cluster-binding protein [Streptomyces sp. NPDC026294]|uniref:2Fe-2S iron-sulfur cluster-binding protein n=1 Tax=Streptomyces sp. NPDC026294 TaxID=3155362 RepID=UPI0033F06FA6
MSDADRPDRNDRRNSPEDTQPLRVVRPQDRQRWEPLPQGNEYESEATAFVQLPDGFTSGPYPGGYGYQGYPDPHGPGTPDAHGGVPGTGDHGGYAADPLAAPGHGYTPPSSFAPPTPGATTDPSATGQWTLPFADAPATDLPAHGMTGSGPHTGAPGGHYTDGTDGASHALWPAAGTDGSSGTTGQWAIPTAPDEMLEESGEYLLGDDRTHPASGYGTAYGPYDHGHGHGHTPVDPAATGQWHFTTDQHTGAGHLPYGQQPLRPADQVTPGYDPGHHVPASGDSAGGTLGGAGNWSLPADALAQWPPRAEPLDERPAEPRDGAESGAEAEPDPEPVSEPEPEAGEDVGQAASGPVVSGPIALGPAAADAVEQGVDGSGTPAAGTPAAGALADAGARTDAEARTDEATGEAPADATAEAGVAPAAATRAATDAPPAADAQPAAPEAAGPEEAADGVPAEAATPEAGAGTEPESGAAPGDGTAPGTDPETPSAESAPTESAPAEPVGQAAPDAPAAPPAEPAVPGDAPTEPAAAPEPETAPDLAEPAATAEEPPAAPDAAPAPGTTPPPAGDTAVAATPAPTPADDTTTEPLPFPHDEHPHTSYVLSVNGTDRPVTDAWIGESLLYVLRERLGLAGAKDGCSQGECGACSVQVDGRLVASCLVPAATTAGSEVRTVEGLAQHGAPSDVQRALADSGAVQCGFCIPGMAMTVHDLLEGNHAPTELETRQALCGNLCRCSGYRGVLDAVNEVVRGRADAAAAAEEAAAAAPEEPGTGTPRIPHQAGPADPQGPASHGHHPHGPHPHGPGADPQSGGSV